MPGRPSLGRLAAGPIEPSRITEQQRRLFKGFSDFEERIWSGLQKEHFAATPAEPIFHYTTAPAFLEIIKTKSLWATDVRAVNDPTEGRYATDLFDEAVRWVSENKNVDGADAVIMRQLIDAEKRRRDGESEIWTRQGRLFVASFSGDGDDLGQWRMYADDGRGVSFSLIPQLVRLPAEVTWGKVVYERTVQLGILSKVVGALTAESESQAKAEGIPIEEVSPYAKTSMEHLLDRLRAFFKHPAYEHENEWRLVRRTEPYQAVREIHVRSSGPRLVSHLSVDIASTDGFVPLGDVILGPAQVDRATETAVRDLLSSRGYWAEQGDGPDVRTSDVPYRSLG